MLVAEFILQQPPSMVGFDGWKCCYGSFKYQHFKDLPLTISSNEVYNRKKKKSHFFHTTLHAFIRVVLRESCGYLSSFHSYLNVQTSIGFA